MLELKDISRNYGDFELKEVSLNIRQGEYFVLLGRSGAGKSQLLEIIAGLRSPDRGSIFLNGEDISREKIQKRKIGMVFQDFAVFPHLSVFENIAYPLKMKKESRVMISEKVRNISDEMNITHLLNRRPEGLSGGERQRVAVARTLVTSPSLMLLDEPMASIDTPLRDDIRRLLRKINRDGMTILHVTHDYREAIRLAQRVGVIHKGRIIQTGEPEMVFSKPVNRFVARFAGIRNFFRINIKKSDGKYIGHSKDNKFILPENQYPEDALLMIKSEDLHLQRRNDGKWDNCLSGRILELNRTETGYESYINAGDIFHVAFSDQKYRDLLFETGQLVFLCFASDDLRVV